VLSDIVIVLITRATFLSAIFTKVEVVVALQRGDQMGFKALSAEEGWVVLVRLFSFSFLLNVGEILVCYWNQMLGPEDDYSQSR